MRRGNTKEAVAIAKEYILDKFNGDLASLAEAFKKTKEYNRNIADAQKYFATSYLTISYNEMDEVLSKIYDLPIEKAQDFTCDETSNRFESYMYKTTEKIVSEYEKENTARKTLSDVKKSVAEKKSTLEHPETNINHNGR